MKNDLFDLGMHIHGTDRSIEAFVQNDKALALRIVDGIQPARLFSSGKIAVAGEYSLTAFVVSRITRIDFIGEGIDCWEFPPDVCSVVELSEKEFHQRAHPGDPARMEKREQSHPPGGFVIRFLDIEMLGGERVFLAVEIAVALPAERLIRIHRLLSAPALHFRLRQGGIAVLNLANMARFTAYPGPEQTPADAWPAHHIVSM